MTEKLMNLDLVRYKVIKEKILETDKNIKRTSIYCQDIFSYSYVFQVS